MSLQTLAKIEINGSANSDFDHGAFDAKTRRVFVAHTALNRVEVIDHDAGRHMATLDGFPRRQVSSPMKVKFSSPIGDQQASLASMPKHWRRNLFSLPRLDRTEWR
jgi:hypothetical protein